MGSGTDSMGKVEKNDERKLYIYVWLNEKWENCFDFCFDVFFNDQVIRVSLIFAIVIAYDWAGYFCDEWVN